MSLNQKVAIVTGASSGIGAAIAEKFSNEGAQVVMVGRNETKLNTVAAKCNNPLVIKAEIRNDEDIVRIIEETIKNFGKIDILVNNAGTTAMGSVLVGDILKAYDEVMKVNLRAVIHLTKLAAPHLIATKGNIVNISSINANQTTAIPHLMMYSCSKAALNHYSKDIALELSPHKVRVNVISPGPVYSDILENAGIATSWDTFKKNTALDRISEPEEIADIALFLACDKAKGITGSIYVADNGRSLKA